MVVKKIIKKGKPNISASSKAIVKTSSIRSRKSCQCKKKCVCKKKHGCKPIKARKSAFRAISGADQFLTENVFQKVKYQVEELDLNNEYNASRSTFRPKHSGIYFLLASVAFEQITRGESVSMDLEIRVNNVPRISDREQFGVPNGIGIDGIISTSGSINLKSTDRVEVFARPSRIGGDALSGFATRFEGVRIPQ
jgi:hypothetical protein